MTLGVNASLLGPRSSGSPRPKLFGNIRLYKSPLRLYNSMRALFWQRLAATFEAIPGAYFALTARTGRCYVGFDAKARISGPRGDDAPGPPRPGGDAPLPARLL